MAEENTWRIFLTAADIAMVLSLIFALISLVIFVKYKIWTIFGEMKEEKESKKEASSEEPLFMNKTEEAESFAAAESEETVFLDTYKE